MFQVKRATVILYGSFSSHSDWTWERIKINYFYSFFSISDPKFLFLKDQRFLFCWPFLVKGKKLFFSEMISSFQNSGMMAFESAEIQLPRKDFGKKSSNLEQSIQKIKVRKSLLMAEIFSSNKEKDNSKNEENNKPVSSCWMKSDDNLSLFSEVCKQSGSEISNCRRTTSTRWICKLKFLILSIFFSLRPSFPNPFSHFSTSVMNAKVTREHRSSYVSTKQFIIGSL